MKQVIDLNIVVDIDQYGIITVLKSLFLYDHGMHGATGAVFEPITETEYNESMDDENVVDYLIDNDYNLPREYQKTGFEGMVGDMSDYDKETLLWDDSYRELWGYLRKAADLNEQQAKGFNCISVGRCLPQTGNHSSLWPDIQMFENEKTPIHELQAIIDKYQKIIKPQS